MADVPPVTAGWNPRRFFSQFGLDFPQDKKAYVSINDATTITTPEPSITIEEQNGENILINNDHHKKYKLFGISGLIIASLIILLTFMIASRPRRAFEQALLRTTTFRPVTHPEPPTPLWGSAVKPYPTGAFWTNLVVRNGDGAIGVYPYGIKTTDAGVLVSYGASRRVVTNTAITDPFQSDIQIGSTQGFMGRAVESYDNVSVTVCYKTATNGKYRTHLVKGSPFITVVYEAATPIISSAVMKIVSVDARLVRGSLGVQYLLTLGNNQKWLVYCSEPVALIWRDNTLYSPNPIRGFIRVAILPGQNSEAAFNMLLQYVQRYPTGASMALAYPSTTISTVSFQFITVGNGLLLMYALPHHVAVIVQPAPDSDENKAAQDALTPIWSIKGKLKALVGDTWRLQYNTPTLGWNYVLTDKLSIQQLDEIAKQLMIDIKSVIPSALDPYTFGKELSRMARLAQIADNLGIPDARQQALAALEGALTPWLQGLNPDALLYDKVYGGVVSTNGIADPYGDYGSGWYADHHFHYGYLTYATATLARLDVPYWEANKAPMETIIRDFCNPDPTDPDFPYARHKDFFDGHSWASGLFQQANGKGQESSSEASNAYYAVYLYALATANLDLSRFAHLLLSMEIQATQFYWHMPNDEIYDAVFSINRMVGNIGALDVTASTWFGSELEYVHGINIMPVTPVTAILFDQQYVMTEYPALASRLPPPASAGSKQCANNVQCAAAGILGYCCPTPEGAMLACCDPLVNGQSRMQDEWKSLIYIDHAVIDRDAAWNQVKSISGFGPGGSKSNSLFWVASRLPTLIGFNSTAKAPDVKGAVKSACVANSACDAMGLVGQCCPSDPSSSGPGTILGCCPLIHR